jgi:carboxyl-terminal processing protease
LPWTQIAPAEYTPVATQKPLIAPLTAEHDARAKTDPAWNLLLDELAAARKLHDQKDVSLNYKARDADRKQQDAQDAKFKQRREALGDVSAISLEPDNGLTPGERNVKKSVAREKAAKKAKDIELEEAAHIMADEAVLLEKDPKLAHETLPKQAFTKPISIATSTPAASSASTAAPASAGSAH